MNPEEVAISRGGGATDNGSFLVVGQSIIGRSKSLTWLADTGIVASYFAPPVAINVFWNVAAGDYSEPGNWTPAILPSNTQTDLYNVFVPGSDDVVTLNFSPTISELHVGTASESEARLEANAAPQVGGFRSIGFDTDTSINASNHGVVRVISGLASRTLQITGMSMEQGPTGIIEAVGMTSMARLQLVECTIVGGTLRSVGPFAEVRIFQGSTLLADTMTEDVQIDAGTVAFIQGTIQNTGNLNVLGSMSNPAQLIPTANDATLQGIGGRVVLNHSQGSLVGSELGVIVNAFEHSIVGQGRIVGPIQNEGAIMATVPGGTLTVEAEVFGTGYLVVDGGILEIVPGVDQTVVSADELLVMAVAGPPASRWTISGDSQAILNRLRVEPTESLMRGSTPPIVELLETTIVSVTESVGFYTSLNFTLSPDALFQIAGDFVNHSTSPDAFHAASGQVALIGEAEQFFELAGRDLGPIDPAGFDDNFALGHLHIQSGSTVQLLNEFQNQETGCEVLYVHQLTLGAGATLHLNDCNVYYGTLNNEGATIVLNGSSLLMSTSAGDLDGDDDRDADDAAILAAVLVGIDKTPEHIAAADLNGDGVADGHDIQLFVRIAVGW